LTAEGKELRVAVTMDTHGEGWELLAPGGRPGCRPHVGRCEFILNPGEIVEADFWIVFANARPSDTVRCAPENTLFIAAEPESKKIYPKAFYRQFHHVIDTHLNSGHPRVTLHAPCMSWHIGLNHSGVFERSHDELATTPCPESTRNQVTVVCSDAAFTEGQRQRLAFLDTLKSMLGDQLVHFGRGFQPVEDKFDAIYGYRFHLVVENSQIPHYWTEKISDAYLGWAFPFYIGSPNITDYFPKDSLVELDITAPERAAEVIQALLGQPRSQKEIAAIAEGRRRVLDTYNPWAAWARWAEDFHQPAATPENFTILTHKAFRPFPRGLLYRLCRR